MKCDHDPHSFCWDCGNEICENCKVGLVSSHRKRGSASLCVACYEEELENDAELPSPDTRTFDGVLASYSQSLLDVIVSPKKKKLGAWPNCPKCRHTHPLDHPNVRGNKMAMVLCTNRKTLKRFWGCSNFPSCRFTQPCSKDYPHKLDKSIGGPCPNCKAHIDQCYDHNGTLLLTKEGKPANSCNRCRTSLVWEKSTKNGWVEFHFKGKKPVSKKQEEHMFIEKKWYIVRKPSGSANTQETSAGRVIWDKNMDQYDGKPLEINHMTRDGKLAYFKGIHSYAFHSGWTKGPFDTRQDAYQSMIKIVARREPDVEADIVEFENGLAKFYDEAVCEKIDEGHIHLKDPKTGIVSVVDKHVLETGERKKSNMAKKIRDRWKNKKPSEEAKVKYDKWCEGRPTVGETRRMSNPSGTRYEQWDGSKWCERTNNGPKLEDGQSVGDILFDERDGHMKTWDGTKWRTVTSPRSAPKGSIQKLASQPTQEEFDELKKKVDNLAKPEEALAEKAKDLNEQYNDDIDDIFQEYHDRNKRRDELNERISSELGKDEEKSGGWLYPVLAVGGSLAALGWASYTLYPHLEGIRYYAGF